MATFTEDEMNILATAIANLANTRSLCKISPDPYDESRTKYTILCSDGKRRRVRQHELVDLIERITALSGHEITEDAKSILREAGLG